MERIQRFTQAATVGLALITPSLSERPSNPPVENPALTREPPLPTACQRPDPDPEFIPENPIIEPIFPLPSDLPPCRERIVPGEILVQQGEFIITTIPQSHS